MYRDPSLIRDFGPSPVYMKLLACAYHLYFSLKKYICMRNNVQLTNSYNDNGNTAPYSLVDGNVLKTNGLGLACVYEINPTST